MVPERTYGVIKTLAGPFLALFSPLGLWQLSYASPTDFKALEELVAESKWPLCQDQDLEALQHELNLYWKGIPVDFVGPIDFTGYTLFQRKVLQFVRTIPYGQTATYGAVAQAVGSPKACRAAGQALHINRTPLVVPCHRVIGSKGQLTGFGGGLKLKQRLLELERQEESMNETGSADSTCGN